MRWLKHLAIASGHRGETLTSLGNASHFNRTHGFLMQVWKAIYHYFFQHRSETSVEAEAILQAIQAGLLVSDQQYKEGESYDSTHSVESENSDLYCRFAKYRNRLAESNDKLKFWLRFVFEAFAT